jgi:peptidoglycan hydrolase CwlO-like protein|tara:strand:- start:6 stop:215 length:210 start_codon:yes stop_codon:yes gene_type:complete
MTDQQEHLKNLLNQQKDLAKEVQALQEQIENRRQTFFKVQGAIEYLNQVGVELEGLETAEDTAEEATEE